MQCKKERRFMTCVVIMSHKETGHTLSPNTHCQEEEEEAHSPHAVSTPVFYIG